MRVFLGKALVLFLLLSLSLPAAAASGPVMLNVDVPAGQWKGARLKNLPKDAVVAVQVECDGRILVALVDSETYRRSPRISHPLFLGQVEGKLSFSVTIAKAGHHYLIFDNRSGTETRAVRVTVHAARGGSDQLASASKILREFERQLHKIFVFDPIPIRVRKCGAPRACPDSAGIVLCAEYIYYLYDILEDQERSKDVLSFSIFYEFGHALLSAWDHPFSSNTEVTDEFATVLMVMVDHDKRVAGAAEVFLENPAACVALNRLLQDERHPLSLERAKKVQLWLKDPHLVRNWQSVLVPHMQTSLLKILQKRPTPWTDLALVEQELARRNKKSI